MMDGATKTAPFSERLAALVLCQTEDIKVLLLCLHFPPPLNSRNAWWSCLSPDRSRRAIHKLGKRRLPNRDACRNRCKPFWYTADACDKAR